MTMTPNERLKLARTEAGFGTATEAAEALGISRATYIGHENGLRGFRAEAAEKYGRRFGVRAGWLMTGEQPKSRTGDKPEPTRVSLEEWDPAAPDGATDIDVVAYAPGHQYAPRLTGGRPEIDVRAGAGEGATGDTAMVALSAGESVVGHAVLSEWVLPASFYRHELHASPGAIILMQVHGDSMWPTLQSGDRVIIDTKQASFASDGLYVFHDGDGIPRVKRLSKVLFSDPPAVEVISDNPQHPKQTASLADVMIFGRVVGRISRL
jgi:phage repressor protein C with HTH and peptisase S24 domain